MPFSRKLQKKKVIGADKKKILADPELSKNFVKK